ncbi:MAG: zinc ribbon domain-containing protein [Planctomycetota bacterium]|nr:zinc ribbon domain-containing protein [Planctomycetota bacterium]
MNAAGDRAVPTYVYVLDTESGAEGCAHCRAGFEAVQRMKEAPLEACPRCGASVHRAIQPPCSATWATN